MSGNILKSGAITSALVYAFCWQLPLVLAGLGLGGLTFAVWAQRYRWIFLILTFLLIGGAFYKVFKDRKQAGPWSLRLLYGTTVLCTGLVIYTLMFK